MKIEGVQGLGGFRIYATGATRRSDMGLNVGAPKKG